MVSGRGATPWRAVQEAAWNALSVRSGATDPPIAENVNLLDSVGARLGFARGETPMARARRKKKRISSERAVPHVRQFLGQRVRELRKQRGLSQEGLGSQSSLSGKFIGEVERGEKSISIDSLYKVSVSLGVLLGQLTNVARSRGGSVPSQDAEKIFALVSARHPSAKLRRAYSVLREFLQGR
jgi:XRE family transcriptional regulator, regulator of sulfur utilization